MNNIRIKLREIFPGEQHEMLGDNRILVRGEIHSGQITMMQELGTLSIVSAGGGTIFTVDTQPQTLPVFTLSIKDEVVNAYIEGKPLDLIPRLAKVFSLNKDLFRMVRLSVAAVDGNPQEDCNCPGCRGMREVNDILKNGNEKTGS